MRFLFVAWAVFFTTSATAALADENLKKDVSSAAEKGCMTAYQTDDPDFDALDLEIEEVKGVAEDSKAYMKAFTRKGFLNNRGYFQKNRLSEAQARKHCQEFARLQ